LTGQLPFTILPATWRDLGELNFLERACFDQDAWPWWDVLGTLTLPGVTRLKAVAEERMVGFAAVDHRPSEHAAWITTIGVLPEFRRKGIARALLGECERATSLPAMRLCVRRSNQAAIDLYNVLGYRQVNVWQRYYIGGEDALVLEKNLA
jgi:ribosomal-protein-alanine N-acetyltransferase